MNNSSALAVKGKTMICEKNYAEVKEILESKELYIFDMDGTIYLGGIPFDYAVRFINKLRETGRRILFFTNNASHSPEFYMQKLSKLGFNPSFDEICTSGNVTGAFLTSERAGKKVYLVGTPELYGQLREMGVDLVCDENGVPEGRDADIVVTSFDTTLNYDKLVAACDFIRAGAEYLSTHPDYNCPTETGFIPDSGAIAALVTASTGKTPTYFGKPYPETVRMISEITNVSKDKMIIFGDRLYTDIATGRRHGITSALVLSGETTPNDVAHAEEKDRPDIMLESLRSAEKIMFSV